MPTLSASTETDATVTITENKQFKMEYKAKLIEALHRIRIYDDNLVKSYALIWERCNTAMQNRLEQRMDYEITIYNDPIELLKAIKEHALNYQETRYEMSIISDAFRALFSAQNKEKERTFKSTPSVLKPPKKYWSGTFWCSRYTSKVYPGNANIRQRQLNCHKWIDLAIKQTINGIHLFGKRGPQEVWIRVDKSK
jgi:hypothetical protein